MLLKTLSLTNVCITFEIKKKNVEGAYYKNCHIPINRFYLCGNKHFYYGNARKIYFSPSNVIDKLVKLRVISKINWVAGGPVFSELSTPLFINYFWPFWSFFDNFVTFLTHSDHFRPFLTLLYHFCPFQNNRDYLGPCWPNLYYFELFGIFSDHLGLLRRVLWDIGEKIRREWGESGGEWGESGESKESLVREWGDSRERVLKEWGESG